jgi:D-sedoheptulose 7-phosphate isomerase
MNQPLQPMAQFHNYAEEAKALLSECCSKTIENAAQVLFQAFQAQRTVFACGNGGSASSCSHFIEDLLKLMWQPQPNNTRLRAFSLTDPAPLLLALANDDGYEHVFSYQLAMQSSPGDVLICVSGSGNSPNVLHAAAYAQEHGITTIGLTGYDGGELQHKVHCHIHVPSHNMGMLEGIHLLILDYIAKHCRYLAYNIPHSQR